MTAAISSVPPHAVASASGTRNENEIWTAGHCLVNTEANNQVVDSSAVFIPAYNGNLSDFDPFGEFVWTGAGETSTSLATTTAISPRTKPP